MLSVLACRAVCGYSSVLLVQKVDRYACFACKLMLVRRMVCGLTSIVLVQRWTQMLSLLACRAVCGLTSVSTRAEVETYIYIAYTQSSLSIDFCFG